MRKITRPFVAHGRASNAIGSLRLAAILLAVLSVVVFADAQTSPAPALNTPAAERSVGLAPNELAITGGKAEAVEYQGRQAIRLTTQPASEQVLAFLKGVQFQDGTIEADIALKTTTPPGVRMPGFVGLAFRARADGSHYDLVYLRPGNSHSEDQAMRNHSVQYVAAPGYDWYKLRREWPWVYESHAELRFEHWSRVRIEVHGRSTKLFIDGSENPSLVVSGLKGEDLSGGVALWGFAGEEAYFANVKVTPAAPEPIKNDGEIAGSWAVEFSTDYGKFKGLMGLRRADSTVTGTWSGDLGQSLPVSGTWRNGYIELTFNGSWPEKQQPVRAALAGWIDGDSGKGRMKLEGRADGQWTATRKK